MNYTELSGNESNMSDWMRENTTTSQARQNSNNNKIKNKIKDR